MPQGVLDVLSSHMPGALSCSVHTHLIAPRPLVELLPTETNPNQALVQMIVILLAGAVSQHCHEWCFWYVLLLVLVTGLTVVPVAAIGLPPATYSSLLQTVLDTSDGELHLVSPLQAQFDH